MLKLFQKLFSDYFPKGNKTYANEFVDRDKKPVPIQGNKYTEFFKWGSKWIVPTDSSKDKDIDGTLCGKPDPDVPEPPSIECNHNYNDSLNCGALSSSSGTWKSCVEVMGFLYFSTQTNLNSIFNQIEKLSLENGCRAVEFYGEQLCNGLVCL